MFDDPVEEIDEMVNIIRNYQGTVMQKKAAIDKFWAYMTKKRGITEDNVEIYVLSVLEEIEADQIIIDTFTEMSDQRNRIEAERQ